MPVTSIQVNGLMAGQQAMFGNYAAYAQQINPYGGATPYTYSNPMEGMGEMMAPPPPPFAEFTQTAEELGSRAVGMLGHVPTAISTVSLLGNVGGMMGSRTLGAIGRVASTFDPFTAAIGGFARGAGWRSGAGVMANLGRIASGGLGGIARAGIGGAVGAAAASFPVLALVEAARYAIGEMVEGAQFQGQVGNVLMNQFRFMNQFGGRGFTLLERHEIGHMLREMGHSELLSTPSEMLRILQQGASTGVFRAVSDAREFRHKFKELVGALKEVATIMNVSLEGAMPFFVAARQQGFWAPHDIVRSAFMARSAAAASGLSVAQVQGLMGEGAQYSRAIGGEGFRGAIGMHRAIQVASAMVGGPGRRGLLSEAEVAELTGGLQGPEAVAALAQQMQMRMTRFAQSNLARWTIAALGREGYRELDPMQLRALTEGRLTRGQIGGSARSNIATQGAANFLLNEERLRGQLLEAGPDAQLGFAASVIGYHRVYSDDPMQQLITRRLLMRFGLAGNMREADVMVRRMKELPQRLRELRARTELELDQSERERERQLNETWSGLMRQVGKWWDRNVTEPLQKAGAAISDSVSEAMESFTRKLLGGAAIGHRFGKISAGAAAAIHEYAVSGGRRTTGMDIYFGDAGEYARELASVRGRSVSKDEQEWLRKIGVKEEFMGESAEGFEAALRTGKYIRGTVKQIPLRAYMDIGWGGGEYSTVYYAFNAEEARKAIQGYRAAIGGPLTEETARGLGYSSVEEARAKLERIRELLQNRNIRLQMATIAVYGEERGRELGRAYLRTLPLLREAVGQGEEYQQIHRLAAAMGPEAIGGFLGVDLRGEAPESLEGAGVRLSEKELSKRLTEAEEKVASAFVGSWGYTLKAEDIHKLYEQAPGTADIIQVLGSSKAPKEMQDAAKNRALSIIDKYGSTLNRQQREFLLALATGRFSRKESAALGELARMLRARQEGQFLDTVTRRAERARKALGTAGLEGIERLAVRGNKAAALVQNLLSQTPGSTREYIDQLNELIAASQQMKEEDRAALLNRLQGISSAEHIVRAIEGGGAVSGLAAQIAKGSPASIAAVNSLVQSLTGKTLSTGQIQAIRKGTGELPAEIQEIINKASGVDQETLRELFYGMRRQDTKRIERALTRGVSGEVVAAITGTTLDERIKQITGRESPEFSIGRPGGPEWMAGQVRLANTYLKTIADSVAPVPKAPQGESSFGTKGWTTAM